MKQFVFFFLNFITSIAFLVLTFILVFNATEHAYNFAYGLSAEVNASTNEGSKEIEVVIKKNATTKDIAKTLYDKKLISNELLFRVQSALSNKDDSFIPGTYFLNTNMDEEKIINVLTSEPKKDEDIKVTFLEGFTVKQITSLLEKEEIVTSADFNKVLDNTVFQYDFISDIPKRNNRFEGYLFPDTYFFSKSTDSDAIISKLLRRFDDIYDDELESRANVLGLTMDEVIIMASIIEKEVRLPEEREIVAGLIYNRLDQDMNLQMCSTIMYALNKRKDRLLLSDTEVDSPYNTYKYPGLPVGPICNPGEASIRAVLYPDKNDYLYFVLMDEETGEHLFTSDYDEFLEAKQKYNEKF